MYDAEGRLLRRIGGRGEGPGEFRGSPRFGVVGDTLWAYDLRARRITLFDRAGNVLSTGRAEGLAIPLPLELDVPWLVRYRIAAAGQA